jgi:diguanylate cyclase (GGDEF)-like protein
MGVTGKFRTDLRRWWREPPAAATPEVIKVTTGLLYIVNAVGGSIAAALLPAFDGVRAWVYVIAAVAVVTGAFMLRQGHKFPRYFWNLNDEWGIVLVLAFALLGSRGGHGSVALVAPLLVYSLNTPFMFSLRDATISLSQVFVFAVAALIYMRVPMGEIVLVEGNAMAMAVLATWVAHQSDSVEEDALTWLPNRRGLERRFQALEREGALPAVAIIDIDNFKLINDAQGHHAGDRVLAACASAWRRALPPGVVLCRLGGDEFAVVMPGMSEDAGRIFVESLGTLTPEGVTISGGVARLRRGESEADVMRRADHALYEAKAAGRNRVVVFDGVTPNPVEPADVA